MPSTITLDGAAAVQGAYRAARRALVTRWEATTRRHAFRVVRSIQARHRSGAATTDTATRVGTGALRASYTQQTERTAHGIETRIGLMRLGAQGQALRYGAVHEEGATIRSASGKMLAIPLAAIRSPSGVAPPPSSFSRKETFVIKGKFGGGVIARRLAGGVIQPLYALRRQVVIPARPRGGAINAVFDALQPELQRALEQDAVAVINGEAA